MFRKKRANLMPDNSAGGATRGMQGWGSKNGHDKERTPASGEAGERPCEIPDIHHEIQDMTTAPRKPAITPAFAPFWKSFPAI
jgi:hypothetical protein